MKGTVSKTRFFGQSHWMNGVNMVGCPVSHAENPF
jgi:hypothetical protein